MQVSLRLALRGAVAVAAVAVGTLVAAAIGLAAAIVGLGALGLFG